MIDLNTAIMALIIGNLIAVYYKLGKVEERVKDLKQEVLYIRKKINIHNTKR